MNNKPISLLALVLSLSACGPSPTTGSASGSKAAEARIGGYVLTDEGPAAQTRVGASDRAGNTIAKAESNGEGRYELRIPPGTAYPVVLTAQPKSEPAPLKAVITSDLVTDQDISAVTTIVVETALSLGGLTEANLAKAAGAAISQRRSSGGSGGSSGFKGDPTKQYGGWH